MAPLAFIQCVILSHMSGELEQIRRWSARELTPWTAVALGLNGAIAFGLNIVSFTANKKAGPLSMTVAGAFSRSLGSFDPCAGSRCDDHTDVTDSKRKAGFIHHSCGGYL
jgi:hypothetical protein